MLVLTRKPGEKVVIDNNIVVTVLEVVGNRIRIGVDAPDDVQILRGELACWLEAPAPDQDQEIDEPCMVYARR